MKVYKEIMAAQKNKKSSGSNISAAALQEQKKFRRGTILLIVFVILLVVLAVAGWFLNKHMFSQNKRLTLQVVEISSSGFWDKNPENCNLLIRKLGLNISQDNITALDLEKLRRDLLSLPNVADGQLSVKYPDTLVINIKERVPRAFLGTANNSTLVVDEQAVVMDARQCFGVHPKMPVIMLHRDELNKAKPGGELPSVKEALSLILAVQEHPRFSISTVSVFQQGKLTATLSYRRNNSDLRYYVTLPVGNYDKLLDITGSAIEKALRQNNTLKTLDVTFDGMVVFKP